MPENQGKLTRFWQELKRRKVFGVVTTYAATAYIIIEVINNLIGPFHLPQWMPTLAALLLVVGLPVVVILSWIFDFTPQGIKKTESVEESETKEIPAKPTKRKLRPSYVLNAILIIAVIILAYPKIFQGNTLDRLASSGERVAIAVMPFQNMTNDTAWNVFQSGIQGSLISYLSNVEELKVRQKESINTLIQSDGVTEYASLSPSVAGLVSKKLDADIFISGSINKAGTMLRVDAQLIDTKTKEVFKSFELNRPYNEGVVFDITDSLRKKIKDFLLVSKLIKENPGYERYPPTTTSPEAFRYYLCGNNAFAKADWPAAIEWCLKALAIDSTYIEPMFVLSMAYGNQGMREQSLVWVLKLYNRNDMSTIDQLWAKSAYADYFEPPEETIKYLKQLQQIDDQNPNVNYMLALMYNRIKQYDKGILEFEKCLEISRRWGKEFLKESYAYPALGEVYHITGQYKKEKKLYKEAEKVNPDHKSIYFSWVIRDQGMLALTLGDTVAANRYIKKFISVLKENSSSDADIAAGLALMFRGAEKLEKAEEYYRKSLLLDPANPERINTLACFLIDNDRNINEGLELIDKALKQSPDNYNYLDTKGWGLYKKGRTKEALEFLEKSWEQIKPSYNHAIFLHLEEVKKAISPLYSPE